MVNDFGDQLQVVGIDTTQLGGSQVYQAAIERYQIPLARQGVPTLIVGNVVLVGSHEIPQRFPAPLKEGLAEGGIDWPDIPGLALIIPEAQPEPSPTSITTAAISAVSTSTVVPQPTRNLAVSPTATRMPSRLQVIEQEIPPAEVQRPPRDPVGFALAGVALAGMVIAFSYSVQRLTMLRRRLPSHDSVAYVTTRAIPLVAGRGLGIAAYLAYVEITQVEAVCGPVGECNIVQSSPYAQILGIPVAVLGVLSYASVGVLWVGQRYTDNRRVGLPTLGLVGLTITGTLFSIYLTYLELFVIHAVCAWCLSSAVTITVMMLLAVVAVTSGRSPERTYSRTEARG
jgi:uncharacterized membrane protein